MRKRKCIKRAGKRVCMQKSMAVLLSAAMAVTMVPSVGTGNMAYAAEVTEAVSGNGIADAELEVLTVDADETAETALAKNMPVSLAIYDDESGTGDITIIKAGVLQADGVPDNEDTIYQGTNWYYDSAKNQLVLNGASIRDVICKGGDLSILLSGENTLSGEIKFNVDGGSNTLEINGGNDNGSLIGKGEITVGTGDDSTNNLKITGATTETVDIECNGDLTIEKSHIVACPDGNLSALSGNTVSITDSYVKAKSTKDMVNPISSQNGITISGSQILVETGKAFGEESVIQNVDSSNSIITKQWKDYEKEVNVTKTYVYGKATLKEDLTIASGESIEFESGACITNPEKLTLEDGASLLVDGAEHTHNKDGDITYTWKDDNKHIKNVACKDCPIGYVTNETESHSIGENGFCACNNAYQPADLTTNKYDIDGDKINDEVYEISNAGQLYWFAGLVNGTLSGETQNTSANAVLTADIVVNKNVLKPDGTLNEGTFKEWTPIATSASPYTGIFDGQNHTISGLYFNQEDSYDVGLFSRNNGKIANAGILDSYFYGTSKVGGVCGNNYTGTITNCYNTGSVSGLGNLGGVSGYNYTGSITNCYNTGNVSGSSGFVGGVSGCNSKGTIINSYNAGSVSGLECVGGVSGDNDTGSITDCYNIGSVSGSEGYVGGVNGWNKGTITNCYNVGSVSGTEHYVGGVNGYNDGGTITNCYNTGSSVSGSEYVGGVNGRNKGTITNCYNTGSVSGTGVNVGGVIGRNESNATIKNCYYDSTIYTGTAIGYDGGTTEKVEGKTTAQFASGEIAYLLSQGCTIGEVTYDGTIWGQTIGTDTYPTLGGAKVYKNAIYEGCEGKPGEPVSYEYSNTEKNTYGEHPDLDNDGKCDDCGAIIDGIGAKLVGYSLSLTGNIGVNFYMELSNDIVNDESAYMNFTLPNGTTSKVYVSGTHEDGSTATTDTTVKNGVTYYVFTCEVAAKEMTSDIKAQMIGNNGEKTGKVYTYTVKEYADYILSHMSAEESDISKATIQLVKGMLNYGGAAQKYFGYKTDKLASDGLTLTGTVFNDTSIINNITNEANKASVTCANAKVTFKSAYLSLNSTTDLCVSVQFADDVTVKEDMFAIWCNTDQISKDQYEVTKVNEENCYKITLHGVKASQLNEKYAFYVELSDTEYAELAYGTNSYAYTVMSSACDNINNIESLREVVKALYAYGSCAQEYEYYKNDGNN